MPIDTSMYSNMVAGDIGGAIEGGMRLGDLVKQRREDSMFRDAIKKNTDASGNTDRKGTLSMLAQGGYSPEKTIAWQKQLADLDASDMQKKNAQFEQSLLENELVGQVAGGIKDQSTYDQGLKFLASKGVDTSKMPTQYDPGLVNQYRQASKSWINQNWREIEAKRDQNDKDRNYGLREKELAQKAKAQKSDSAGNLGKLAADLRKERSGLPTTKTTQDVAAAFNRIQASAQKQTPASDMSLIFNYMKMLDPGSTVREGEYANAEQTRGIPADIVARYNKAREGTMLDPAQREDFLNQAAGLYQSQLDIQNRIDSQYSDYARQAGLDPRNVIVDFGANVLPQKRQAGNAPPAPKHGTVEDNYVFMGGDPSDPKSWKPVSKTASRFRTEME